jgi:protein arginine N-methyltransferase 1
LKGAPLSLIVDEHRQYISDPARMDALRSAISEVVKPAHVVLDLGSGTGILGLLACKAGAKRVYSIDEGGIIELARKVCQANGFEDRMVFIKGLSTQLSLPEKVDVVVADQIGRFGFEAGILEYFSDARERFLKSDGVMIPSRIDMIVAPVECSERWEDIEFWNSFPAGFDFRPARLIAANTGYPVKFRPADLLGLPVSAASLGLYEAKPSAITLNVSIAATRAGILHGVGGWFSAHLSPNVVMSNSPLDQNSIKRMNVFFPIDRPVPLEKGDRVHINIHVMPADMIVTWKVDVWDGAEDSDAEPSRNKGSFIHSTWKGMLMCKENVQRTRPEFKPVLTLRGEARFSVLELCNGERTLSDIEREIFRRHPDLFRSLDEAAVFVAEVVTRYSE